MQRSSKLKLTTRRPLMDISNNRKSTRVSTNKSTSDDVDCGALDRLLLVRSELSNLFGQIDELVAEALGSNLTDRKVSQDIESFGNVLLDMQSTIKPWVSRLKHSLTKTSTVEENQHNRILPSQPTRINILKNKEENETELGIIVSPSPLVSWRTGTSFADSYTIEAGKQLFLLTPLPKSKAPRFNCPTSSKTTVRILHENTSKQIPQLVETTSENILESKPPEEVCSDDAVLKDLTSKYQDLLGNDMKNFNVKDVELDWFLSPPKTCTVMEPTDVKVAVPTPATNGALLMETPLFVDVESLVMKGRNAGENTLKRELWTRFEEVSKDGLKFDRSVFQKLPRKGFMDMLEEAGE